MRYPQEYVCLRTLAVGQKLAFQFLTVAKMKMFLNKFKRAAKLNGQNDDDLPIGLPLYLKGHASAWFKCLQGADEMTSDELSTAMINHFASRAAQWRIRQSLSQLRQLEKESVADYSHNVCTLCAWLSLPRSEWTHYFIKGLRPEIRDYVILQQPDHLDEAENFAQLKELVLASSDEIPTSNAQQLLAQVIEKLSATTRSEDKTLGSLNSQQKDCDESEEMRRVISQTFPCLRQNSVFRKKIMIEPLDLNAACLTWTYPFLLESCFPRQ